MNTSEPLSLRERRQAAGLSQEKLARLADCSTASVALLERGYVPAESPVLQRILVVLNENESGAHAASNDREKLIGVVGRQLRGDAFCGDLPAARTGEMVPSVAFYESAVHIVDAVLAALATSPSSRSGR